MIDEDSKGELSLKIGELNNYQEEKNDKNNKTNCKDFNNTAIFTIMNILSKSYDVNSLDRDAKNETLAINLVDCLINHIYKDFKNNHQYENLFLNWNNCINSIKDKIASNNERIKSIFKSKDDEILSLQAKLIEIDTNNRFELDRLKDSLIKTEQDNLQMKEQLIKLDNDYQILNKRLYDHQALCNQQEKLIQSFTAKINDYEKRFNLELDDNQNLISKSNEMTINCFNQSFSAHAQNPVELTDSIKREKFDCQDSENNRIGCELRKSMESEINKSIEVAVKNLSSDSINAANSTLKSIDSSHASSNIHSTPLNGKETPDNSVNNSINTPRNTSGSRNALNCDSRSNRSYRRRSRSRSRSRRNDSSRKYELRRRSRTRSRSRSKSKRRSYDRKASPRHRRHNRSDYY